jgi:hypothetical protein
MLLKIFTGHWKRQCGELTKDANCQVGKKFAVGGKSQVLERSCPKLHEPFTPSFTAQVHLSIYKTSSPFFQCVPLREWNI